MSAQCPACGSDAVKPRIGSLGEERGVWCTQCGESADSADRWAKSTFSGSSTPTFSYSHLSTTFSEELQRRKPGAKISNGVAGCTYVYVKAPFSTDDQDALEALVPAGVDFVWLVC